MATQRKQKPQDTQSRNNLDLSVQAMENTTLIKSRKIWYNMIIRCFFCFLFEFIKQWGGNDLL